MLTATAPCAVFGGSDRPAPVEFDVGESVIPAAGDAGQDDRSGEVRHEGRAGSGRELAGRSELHHTALVDDGHAVAQLRRLREVMGNKQGGGLACAQHAAELARRRGARAGVER